MKRYEMYTKEMILGMFLDDKCDLCPIDGCKGEKTHFLECNRKKISWLKKAVKTPRIESVRTRYELDKAFGEFLEYCRDQEVCRECKYFRPIPEGGKKLKDCLTQEKRGNTVGVMRNSTCFIEWLKEETEE